MKQCIVTKFDNFFLIELYLQIRLPNANNFVLYVGAIGCIEI